MNKSISTGSSLKGHIFALICAVIWGTTFAISKNLMGVVTPTQLMWTRFLLAYAISWVLYPHWHIEKKDEPWLLLTSLFANTLYFLAENTAITMTLTTNVSIFVASAPIITAVLLRITIKQKLSSMQIVGFLGAFAGIVLIVMNGVFVLKLSPKGDFLAIGAALSFSLYGIVSQRFRHYNSFLLTRKLMFYGILTSAPFLAVSGGLPPLKVICRPEVIIGLVYLGFMASALCYILWNVSLKELGVLKTNLYIYLIPAVTLVTGTIVLDEKITLMGGIGIVLVITGLIMGNRKSAD